MMSRMAASRPPGVFTRSTMSCALRCSASANPLRRYRVVAGPIAPVISRSSAADGPELGSGLCSCAALVSGSETNVCTVIGTTKASNSKRHSFPASSI